MQTLTLTFTHISELGLNPHRSSYLREECWGQFCVSLIGEYSLVSIEDFVTLLEDDELSQLKQTQDTPDYVDVTELWSE